MATITLSSGPAVLTVDTNEDADGCETLADVLDLFRETLNIPSDANVAIDGSTVNPADVSVDDLADDAEVTATKTAGSKG